MILQPEVSPIGHTAARNLPDCVWPIDGSVVVKVRPERADAHLHDKMLRKSLLRHFGVTLADITILFHRYFGLSRTLGLSFIILALQHVFSTLYRHLLCDVCHHTVSILRMFNVLR